MPKKSNPFLVALTVIGSLAGLVAIVLAIVAAQAARSYDGDPSVAVASAAWAGIFAQVAVLAIIGALVAGAVTWVPSEKPANPNALGGDGLTPGERRFFTEQGGL